MNTSPFWNEDWMQVQQKYWQQWSDMSQQAMGFKKPPQSPWEDAMDHWWKAVAPQTNHDSRDFMEKMLAQGKLFFRLGDSLAKNMQQGVDWTESLNKSFEQLQNSFSQTTNPFNNGAENNIQQWMNLMQGPMQQWQKFAGDLPNGLANMQGDNPFSQMLNMPGLGYSRENEDSLKALMQAAMDYQEKLLNYNMFFSDLGNLALQRMKEKVQAMAEKGDTIDSGRAAYDVWVAASEEVYAERTMTADYSALHGELVNALMQVKKIWAERLDEKLAAFGMPTQREVRTLQTRLQSSRRETRNLQTALNNIQKELAELKTQVAELAKQAKPAAAKPATASKKVVSKKIAAKKKAVSQ